MAERQETFNEVSDSDLLAGALSDEAPETVETTEERAEPESDGQPRDENGRFAAKAEEVQQDTAAPAKAQDNSERGDGHVPSWRLREIAEERRQAQAERDAARAEADSSRREMDALRRQMEQNAPKPEPVDIFADPNKWAEQQFTPFEQRMAQMQSNFMLRVSRAENVAIHGRTVVDEAEKAIGEAMAARDPDLSALRARMAASDDPVGIAIEWHKSRSLLKETGGDLNAYTQRKLEEALSDPAFLAKALESAKNQANGQNGQNRPSNTIRLAPSLNRLAPAAATLADDDGDASDSGLFSYATR